MSIDNIRPDNQVDATINGKSTKIVKVLNYDCTGTQVDGATSANQTNGTQKTQVVDASGLSTNVRQNVNTEHNELLVNLEGHQCPANTTIAQLDADASFTGSAWQDTLDYGVLSINVATDRDSATDGLEIQWSNNGTDIADYDCFTIIANMPKTFTFGPAERYYRVKYTNGSAGTTTTFHLTSILRKVYVKPSSHRITDSIVGEDDAELVKSIITGELPNGVFDNVSITVNADGQNHLNSAMIQKIISSAKNTTTTNLASGVTFTGTSDETFGINGIQVYHIADQDCTVYIDQSIDSTNWDISDSFKCLANVASTRSFQSVAPYFRARLTNNGSSTTTYIRFSVGMTPIINPLPRALTDDDRLKTESSLIGRENSERHVWVNPTNELAISPVYRMVGTAFNNGTKDPNFWTDGSLRDGTVTQSGGEIELETNTTANGLALYQSVRKSRFVAGSAQYFSGGFNFVTAGTTNNTRRLGAYTLDASLDVEDGFFFQLSGTTFSIGYARAGSATLVNSGSFNGNLGVNFVPTADTYYSLAIEFTPLGAFWYINGELLHKIAQAHMSDTITLPITMENENTGDSTTDVVLDCVGAYIARQGELKTNPTSYYHAYGSEAGVTLKYGAGTIHTIIFGSAANNAVVTLSDSTTAATPVLWEYDATGALDVPISVGMGGLPFSDGLRLTVSNSASCTIVYE